MTDITFADISEFQSNLDADAYIRGGHRVIIVRTYNGSRNDHMVPGRITYVRGKPFVAVGYYCYLESSIDPVSQAKGFINSIPGGLKANEFPILDHEEGGGNQVPRAEAFLRVTDAWAGFPTTLYAGQSFLDTNLGGTARWGRRPLWIARYLNSYTPNPAGEPAGNTFWQYSDRQSFPGLSGGNDGSIYHGTAEQFLARVRAGTAPPKPPPPAPEREFVVAESGDRTEMFALLPSGEVQHKWQNRDGGSWSGWYSLGRPGA